MLRGEEDTRIAPLLKQAQMIVMRHVSIYIDDWHYVEPGMHFKGKSVFLYILGCPYNFGFVIINEFDRTIKAFDRNMEILRTLEIK